MLIISWNINGIKNRFDELQELIAIYNPDVVCLQKVRCNKGREQFTVDGYQALYNPEDSGSWSGVMAYVKGYETCDLPSIRIKTLELSNEGHLQVFLFEGLTLVNAYVPFANKTVVGAEEYRKQWDVRFRQLITELSVNAPIVICGDLNIVHTVNDTCESKVELNRPCFSKWERENFNTLLQESDLVDAYRKMHPYSIVPTFYGNFRNTGVGNRLDYFLISKSIMPTVKDSDILTHFGTSSSVPISIEL